MLKIEPTRIVSPGGYLVVMIVDGDLSFDKGFATQLAAALTHFAAHGTFCPEAK